MATTSGSLLPSCNPRTLLPLAVFLCALTSTALSSQLAIPHRHLGYVYKPSNATRSNLVTLTVYMDLTCGDSKYVYLTLLQVADQLTGKNFELNFRSFSLPYHRNSDVLTKALHVVSKLGGSTVVFPFISETYRNLNQLLNTATADKTDHEVLAGIVAPIVTKASGIPAKTFLKEVVKPEYKAASRLDFKYGCTRGVYGTPTMMLNDVFVDATLGWTVAQWLDFIIPVL